MSTCVFQITELLTDVERLKQALNGLSQLAYTSNAPNKRHTQQIDTLQTQIKSLQQQLAVSGVYTMKITTEHKDPQLFCSAKLHINMSGFMNLLIFVEFL